MSNPNGPYPGRQIFLGKTPKGKPCFAYFVSGRSPASRERKVTQTEAGYIMGPLGNEVYDWLRHYTAIKADAASGVLAVTNGIQTEAIFEAYRLMYHTHTAPGADQMTSVMTGAQYEPDSLHTPRISGVITCQQENKIPVFILSIITDNPPANTWVIEPKDGTLISVSTYAGDLQNPVAFNVKAPLPVIENKKESAIDIAAYIYEISEATNNGDDIRVCAVGGVLGDDGKTWDIAFINRHKG